ncbi:hypothetical protein DFJ73DRAFT_759502 [Zopfochytrium polystomum]|nr:hypothetical protein DFJ73DRAFT_759502 [Zopfochytrium polystomum]
MTIKDETFSNPQMKANDRLLSGDWGSGEFVKEVTSYLLGKGGKSTGDFYSQVWGSRMKVPYRKEDKPVVIRFWDNPTIGCHPSMCPKMGLDFDGDEVHFAVVSREESRTEIGMAIAVEPEQKFSDSNIAQAVESYLKGLASDLAANMREDYISHDFMMGSTCSITPRPGIFRYSSLQASGEKEHEKIVPHYRLPHKRC